MTMEHNRSTAIASVSSPAGPQFVRLAAAHRGAVTSEAVEILSGALSGPEQIIVFVGDGNDTEQWRPFADAAEALGYGYTAADRPRFARPNLLDFFALLPVGLVFGMNRDIAELIAEQGASTAEVFPAASVYATPGAHRLLHDDVAVFTYLAVGPLVALECQARAGLHVLEGTCVIDTNEDGELIVAVGADLVRTGLNGQVERGICDCGSAAPRLVLRPGERWD